MAGGAYTIYVTVDASGVVTGSQVVRQELNTMKVAAKETQTVFSGMFKFFALQEVVHELYEAADAFLKVKSDMQVAGFAGDKLNDAVQKIGEVANTTRQPIEKLSELYRQLSIYAGQLGAKQEDLFKVTKIVGESFALGGGTLQQVRNGVIQLGHALEQAKVQGQQFNALNKDIPALLLGVAHSLGTTVSGLKAMQLQGKLTGATLYKAILDANDFIEKRFARSIPTLTQAFTILRNQIVLAFAELNKNTGAIQFISTTIVNLANHLSQVAPYLINLGVAMVTVRLALFAYTTVANRGALATLLFGNAVNDAKGKIISSRAAFGGWVTGILLAVTALSQFYGKVKIFGSDYTLNQWLAAAWIAAQRLFLLIGGKGISSVALLATAFLRLRGVISTQTAILGLIVSQIIRLSPNVATATSLIIGLGVAWTILNADMLATNFAAVITGIENFILALGKLITALLTVDATLAPMTFTVLSFIAGFAGGIAVLSAFAFALDVIAEGLDKAKQRAADMGDVITSTLQKGVDYVKQYGKGLLDTAGFTQDNTAAMDDLAAAMQRADEQAKKLKTDMSSSGESDLLKFLNSDTKISGSETTFESTLSDNASPASRGQLSGAASKMSSAADTMSHAADTMQNAADDWKQATGGQYLLGSPIPGIDATGKDTRKTLQFEDGKYSASTPPDKVYGVGGAPDFTYLYDAMNKAVEDQATMFNSIAQGITTAIQADGKLSGQDLKLIEANTGATAKDIAQVEKQNREGIAAAKKAYALQLKVQEQAAAAQARQQELDQLAGQKEGLLHTALKNLGLDSLSQLDPAIRKIADQIIAAQKRLDGTDAQNIDKRLKLDRIIDHLTSNFEALTGTVDQATNAFLDYSNAASDVYKASFGVPHNPIVPPVAPVGGYTGGGGGGGGDGGNGGHRVVRRRRHGGGGENGNHFYLSLNVHGVQDAKGFGRNETQILSRLHRKLKHIADRMGDDA